VENILRNDYGSHICLFTISREKEEIEGGRRFCRYVVELGYIPIAPHVYFPQLMNDLDPKDREKSIRDE